MPDPTPTPDTDLATLAAGVKADVAGVLTELRGQDLAAAKDRDTRTRRWRYGAFAAALAAVLLAALVGYTEVAARTRFTEFEQQQRATFCPLLLPLLQGDTDELTPQQRTYRDQVRGSAERLGCETADPGVSSSPP